jgi:hypothetical protein
MNERVHRIAAELAGLAPDELEEVLRMVGLKSRVRPATRLLVPREEYSHHLSLLVSKQEKGLSDTFSCRQEPTHGRLRPYSCQVDAPLFWRS